MTKIFSPFIVTIFMQATGKLIVSHDILMCEDKDQMDVFADTVIRGEKKYLCYYVPSVSFSLKVLSACLEKKEYILFFS